MKAIVFACVLVISVAHAFPYQDNVHVPSVIELRCLGTGFAGASSHVGVSDLWEASKEAYDKSVDKFEACEKLDNDTAINRCQVNRSKTVHLVIEEFLNTIKRRGGRKLLHQLYQWLNDNYECPDAPDSTKRILELMA